MFFKHEHLLKWFYLGFGVRMFISLFSIGFAELDIRFQNLLNFSKRPKDDTSYQDISRDSVVVFDHHRMSLQFSSDEPIKTWYNPAGELTVITEQVTGNSHSDVYEGSVHCSKLDLDGDVVDTYQYRRNCKGAGEMDLFFEGYHIDLKAMSYHTWALDCDSSKRAITIINENLDMDEQQQQEQHRAIAKRLQFFPHYIFERPRVSSLIYIEDGQCKIFKYTDVADIGGIYSRGKQTVLFLKPFPWKKWSGYR